MEQNGVALDLGYLKELSKLLGDSMAKLEAEIFEYSGRPFNLNSPSQMQKVLFEDLGLPAKAKTKSGYSTDASVLESLVDKHPIVAKILEYRQLTKLKSTYVDALPKSVLERDRRLHGEFHQAKTSTGRLSSSNPNLQNIPIRTELGRAIRKAFIPGDADSVLLSADYSQIELRLLAHMSQDPTLIEAFKLDQDIHARTAMEVYDVPLNEVTSDMRRLGKTINFSLVYQQGAYSTGLDLGISTKEAQAFMDKYFSRYPKVKSFMQKTIDEARQKGYSTTLWGRKRYFQYLNDKREGVKRADERAACNHPLQGSAADLMKLAMVRLYRDLKVKQLQSKLILQVHDELVLEVKRSELDCVKELVVNAMSLDQPFDLPLKVDVHIGENWMEAK
jgi:DNA polymerase-1